MMMTTSSTNYKPGNVIIVRIRFTIGNITKRRPAVILTGTDYHNSRADAIVIALSTQVGNSYYGDYILKDWQTAGLPQPTKAKGVVETIDRTTIEQTLGNLSNNDFKNLKDCVRSILEL
ncbi:MAG: type II toxin-antitoxin system PemK/MazF family toxin [Sedimentisphaerales bacterium]|nr:type II toxin-antitoxin system PemK/MazF family toxin [Sedimentisphaerales bacterium]